MPENFSQEIIRGMRKGEAALWLGPDWSISKYSASLGIIAKVPWLAVWSESSDTSFAKHLNMEWTKSNYARQLIEVPGHIDEVLGSYYKLSDICPCYYLNGNGEAPDTLNPLQRRRSRDSKIDSLSLLKEGLLLVMGYNDETALGNFLDEITQTEQSLTSVLVLESNKVVDFGNTRAANKVQFSKYSLNQFIETIQRYLSEPLSDQPKITILNTSVALDELLRCQPPIDQDFILLTTKDTYGSEQEKKPVSEKELLVDLLSGRSFPWRAFAHNLAWDRKLPQQKQINEAINLLRETSARVVCVDIPCEPGSGLTVFLHDTAFQYAKDGYPCLIHRGDNALDYNRIRTFLTDLYLVAGVQNTECPTIIIFDTPSVLADSQGFLNDLPARLERDNRHVLIIRGVPIGENEMTDSEFWDNYSPTHLERKGIDWKKLPRLRSKLSEPERRNLLKWIETTCGNVGIPLTHRHKNRILTWSTEQEVSLLVSLYFILTDELAVEASLGSHLIQRLQAKLAQSHNGAEISEPVDLGTVGSTEYGKDLTPIAVKISVGSPTAQPTACELISALVVLSALDCLHLSAPRNILADIAGIDANRIIELLIVLDKLDLVFTNNSSSNILSDARLAPAAFYLSGETVRVRHSGFGRLILECLVSDVGGQYRQSFESNSPISLSYFEALKNNRRIDPFPIRLLKPILLTLKPIGPHVSFAELIATRYLRLQKSKGYDRQLVAFQWTHRDLLLSCFTWLNDKVIKQSASLLHSRGITTYKSCADDIDLFTVGRQRYESAAKDLDDARELALKFGGDNPINILTSKGLLYLGWAERERAANQLERASELDQQVEETLRQGLTERMDNNYAAFGLSQFLIERVKRYKSSGQNDAVSREVADDLAEAIELLNRTPEARFEYEWNELRSKGVELLTSDFAKEIIKRLKEQNLEMGYVLEALSTLDGEIPLVPTQNALEINALRQAEFILRQADSDKRIERCLMGNLLRYAIFSALPERFELPAYSKRFELIGRLADTRYLNEPNWMFDFAMLAFQTGQYDSGSEMFAKLRRGKRFFEVPYERSCYLSKSAETIDPIRVQMRIISTQANSDRGLGRIEHPVYFKEPVPFSRRSFEARNQPMRAGNFVPCQIRLRPSGPFAEPFHLEVK